jgi:hypothetical protein
VYYFLPNNCKKVLNVAFNQNSNANILSSLLAILEPGQSDDPEEAANKAKPLIFIIDEFDLFAHSAMRQSMLYCLCKAGSEEVEWQSSV